MVGSSLSKKNQTSGAWLGSEVSDEHIKALRHRRMLPPASLVTEWVPGAEAAPTPYEGEIVVFDEHFYRGFGLPTSPFFFNFLTFFGLQQHHLAPNAILQLAAFVVFSSFPPLPLQESVKQWQRGFFYVKNATSTRDAIRMPPFSIAPLTARKNWGANFPKPAPEVAQLANTSRACGPAASVAGN
ncbi:hypothetical protein D1007_31457 [Hordeum vulgare]|nr:hypothetical protein D1007_31457 [Hordeum vulgare]